MPVPDLTSAAEPAKDSRYCYANWLVQSASLSSEVFKIFCKRNKKKWKVGREEEEKVMEWNVMLYCGIFSNGDHEEHLWSSRKVSKFCSSSGQHQWVHVGAMF